MFNSVKRISKSRATVILWHNTVFTDLFYIMYEKGNFVIFIMHLLIEIIAMSEL